MLNDEEIEQLIVQSIGCKDDAKTLCEDCVFMKDIRS